MSFPLKNDVEASFDRIGSCQQEEQEHQFHLIRFGLKCDTEDEDHQHCIIFPSTVARGQLGG